MRALSIIALAGLCLVAGCSGQRLREENARLREELEEQRQAHHVESDLVRLILDLGRTDLGRRMHLDCFVLDPEDHYGAESMAKADTGDGLFVVFAAHGYPAQVADVLDKQFGLRIAYFWAPRGLISLPVWNFRVVYHRTMSEALYKKTGKTLDDILESQAVKDVYEALQRRYEKERADWWAAERKKIPSEEVRKEIWPLFDKEDFDTAKERLGDRFYDTYRTYVILTQKATTDRELAFQTHFLCVCLENTALGEVLRFIVPIESDEPGAIHYRSSPDRLAGLRPTVLDLPKDKKEAILAKKVTIDTIRTTLPFPVVLKRLGLGYRVEADRLVITLPDNGFH